MLQQNINLYKFLPGTQKNYLTARVVLISYGIFLLLMIIHLGENLWVNHRLQSEVNVLKLQLSTVDTSIAAIKKDYPMINLNDLHNSTAQLQHELDEKNKALATLAQRDRFSPYLSGFAKVMVPGAWLTVLQLSPQERQLTVSGYAMKAEDVQNLLSNLAAEKEFAGFHFELQELKKAELEKEEVLSFIISTKVNPGNDTQK